MLDWITPTAIFLTTVMSIGYTAISTRARATKEDTDKLSEAISKCAKQDEHDRLAEKVNGLEVHLAALPDQDTTKEISEKITAIHGDNREMLGKLGSLEAQVARISDFMMSRHS